MNRQVTNLLLPRLFLIGLVSQLFAGPASAQTVTHIAGGDAHSIFSKSDGSLWVTGYNAVGELGIGTSPAKTNIPQQILSGGVGMVAAGGGYSLFQLSNTLWGMGANDLGQLGDGTTTTRYFPIQVFTTGSASISLGPIAVYAAHTLFRTSHSDSNGTGGFWGTGLNLDGELGDGTFSNAYQSKQLLSVPSGHAVLALAGGGFHSLFVKSDGSLWTCGDDGFGQLGDGRSGNYQVNVPELIVSNSVTAVTAGSAHSLFIKSDGSLWGMGHAGFGQLGDNTTTNHLVPKQLQPDSVVAVAAGANHTLFIRSDGSLWGMGRNANGELGTGDNTNRLVPVRIVASNVVTVAAGWHHTLFIKSDGSLWGMGNNTFGELGVGDYTNRYVPMEIVPPPQPVITGIALAGSNVVISWSTNQGGFCLQSSPILGPIASWSNVSWGVIMSNQYVATNPISGSKKFYRLGRQ